MKNIFLLLLLFLLSGNVGFCDYTFSTTEYVPNPTYYQPYPNIYRPKGMYSQRAFNNLEKKMLMNNFGYESPTERLNRMEEKTFGAIQQGDNYSRYKALQRAMRESRNSRYYSPHHNNLRRRLSTSFRGMPTGFTPPIQTPNYYIPDNLNSSWQSGVKVKIIDDSY